jgi:hypothetical protein
MLKIIEPQTRMILYPMSVEDMTELGTRIEEAHKAGLVIEMGWARDGKPWVHLLDHKEEFFQVEETMADAFKAVWAQYKSATLYGR